MFRKTIIILLISLLTNFAVFAAESTKEKEFAEKVKTEISKLGTGTDAKVKVKLKNGKTIKGYITETNAESFVVRNEKSGTNVEVAYSNAKQVKGNNLSKGTIIGISLGIAVGIIILIFAARN
ncbi:MAG TPA: hypothetical protein PKY59_25770 [Pyrinomonadaceae bacterium]|nr:hypothetical protein [Pyrinomonadaceae bacterium]